MALIACPECKKKISDITDSCPHCGYKLTPEKVAEIKKTEQQVQKGCGIGCLAIVIVLAFIYMIGSSSSDSPTTRTSTPSISSGREGRMSVGPGSSDSRTTTTTGTSSPSVSTGQDQRISGDHWFGCIDREYFDKLVRYAVQDDEEAFTKALTVGLVSGVCTAFENGEVVYISDTAIFSGVIKVRRKGETTEYWTNMEAVK